MTQSAKSSSSIRELDQDDILAVSGGAEARPDPATGNGRVKTSDKNHKAVIDFVRG